ncbi:MAG TPA: NHL repeat-containing protein, partial [Chloroflexota bacterium]|nr:NHL repeat-containing protein [Chloroflexota bacterium]
TRCTLDTPEQLTVDAHGNLLVADSGNNRVLAWSARDLAAANGACARSCHIPAVDVWGQAGDFTTSVPDAWPPYGYRGPCAATPAPAGPCTLSRPGAMAFDRFGHLFIADTGDNRVLEFPSGTRHQSQKAFSVYGQHGSLSSSSPDPGGVNDGTLAAPAAVGLNPSGFLWISDGNNRVLEYPPPKGAGRMAGIFVLGQRSFTTSGCNAGGVSPATLCGPMSVTFDAPGNLYVSDGTNNRVVEYLAPTR